MKTYKKIICPYCGAKFSLSDRVIFDLNNTTKLECHKCNKTYVVYKYFNITYSSHEIYSQEEIQNK